MPGSLRLKLLLSHLGLIVLAMGLAGLLLLTFLQRYFLQATEASLAAQARITAQALIPGALTVGPVAETQSPLTNAIQQRQMGNLSLQAENLALPTEELSISRLDLGYLSDSTLQLGAQLETRIRVLDVTGTVLVDSAENTGPQELGATPLIVQALRGEYGSESVQEGRQAAMAVAMPVLVEGDLAGVVYLTQPLRDVDAVLADLRTRLTWSTAIALVLSGAAALLLSHAITRPLQHLTAAAGAIAEGRLDQQVPVDSRDELGRLSRTFNDMTARLRAARQAQITFVANVSHELRTPLTSIKAIVETLRDGAVTDVTVRDHFLATVETETDRLVRLVNDLLVLTHADTDGLALQRASLDVAELARATLEGLAPRAARRGVTTTLEVDPQAPPAWADGDRIAQVLVNLLDNAIKYSRPGGTVTVRITRVADEVLVLVQDRGIGIPAKEVPYIGQRFYRVDKARTRERARGAGQPDDTQSGSGLGLSIVIVLVEAHGGRLNIESEEGIGTTVSFTLPLA
jgi:two-component system, OmpR family, sensor kinase